MKSRIKKITIIGTLTAMSEILYLFPTFPILPAFSWLEIDFADIPALFASILISPAAGAAVVLIRNTVHLTVSSTAMTGELSNFLISALFVFAAGMFYRLFAKKNAAAEAGIRMKNVVCALVLGTVCQVITAMLVNYFIMIPLYSAFINFDELGKAYYIFGGVLPFNIIKCTITSAVFVPVVRYAYPPIRRMLAE